MATHPDDEQLAEWVVEGTVPDAAAVHLRQCERCRESLARLREIAGRLVDLPRVEQPPAAVWSRIGTELDLGPREVTTPFGTPHHQGWNGRGPEQGRSDVRLSGATPVRSARSMRGPLAIAASVAAVLGIGAGILGTLLVTSGDSKVPAAESIARLEPLAGKTGAGDADLVRTAKSTRLQVSVSGLTKTPGFYEVWLINEDGKRMVSLGVLDPAAGGTFQVPSNLTGQGYRIVDISLEPDDGNPEHSHNSVVRGTLPG